MKRDIGIFLEDVLESIKQIEEYTNNIKEEDFYKDIKLQDAVVRRFEIIGEAVKHISSELKAKYPEIPWKQISGTRDILTHEYFGVNLERIWETIRKDIVPFKGQIQKMLEDIDKQK